MSKAPPRTFGPAVIHEKDGTFRAVCTWCHFRIHASCTFEQPYKTIPDSNNTPDWCQMKADMLRDAKDATA